MGPRPNQMYVRCQNMWVKSGNYSLHDFHFRYWPMLARLMSGTGSAWSTSHHPPSPHHWPRQQGGVHHLLEVCCSAWHCWAHRAVLVLGGDLHGGWHQQGWDRHPQDLPHHGGQDSRDTQEAGCWASWKGPFSFLVLAFLQEMFEDEEDKKVKYQEELFKAEHPQGRWQDDLGRMGELCYGEGYVERIILTRILGWPFIWDLLLEMLCIFHDLYCWVKQFDNRYWNKAYRQDFARLFYFSEFKQSAEENVYSDAVSY